MIWVSAAIVLMRFDMKVLELLTHSVRRLVWCCAHLRLSQLETRDVTTKTSGELIKY